MNPARANEARRRRVGSGVLVVALVIVSLAGCAPDLPASGAPASGLPPSGTPTTSPHTVQPEAMISVGSTPDALATDGSSIWALTNLDLERIEPATNSVVSRFPLPATTDGFNFAIGAGSLWVGDFDNNAVYRLDETTGVRLATIAAGLNPGGLLYADGSVWVAEHRSGTIDRIDPATNRIVATITVSTAGTSGPSSLASGAGSIWVGVSRDSTIVRVDPATNTVSGQVAISPSDPLTTGGPMAFDQAHAWTDLGGDDDALAQIDPRTNQITSRLGFIGNLGTPLVKDGIVWVPRLLWYDSRAGQLVAVDATSDTVVDTIAIPGNPDAILSAFGAAWVELGKQGIIERLPISALTVHQ